MRGCVGLQAAEGAQVTRLDWLACAFGLALLLAAFT